MKWKAYPSYKYSGIKWLGNIPEHWDSPKLRRLSAVKRGASPRPIDDQKYFDENGEYSWVRIADVTASKRYLERTTQKLSDLGKQYSVPLDPGDIFLSIAGSVGKPVITKIKCCIHDGFVYFPQFKQNKEFLYYVFASEKPYLGLGKLGTQLNLNTDIVGNIHIGLPSIQEQKYITLFLDRKTEEIDALIEKKQRQIELLKKKRSALISHAVTKGLNPDIPMKPSGIPWLGEIPEHWDVIKLGYVSRIVRGGSPRPAGDLKYFEGNFIPWITVAEVTKDDSIYLDSTAEKLTKEGSRFSRIFEEGTLLLTNSGATLGVPKISKIKGCANDGIVGFLSLSKNLDIHFLYFYLKSITEMLRERIKQGSGQPNLNTDIIKSLFAPLPPRIEQSELVRSLIIELEKIDKLKTAISYSIGKLQEYRSALISAAVTGKIDVRDEVNESEATFNVFEYNDDAVEVVDVDYPMKKSAIEIFAKEEGNRVKKHIGELKKSRALNSIKDLMEQVSIKNKLLERASNPLINFGSLSLIERVMADVKRGSIAEALSRTSITEQYFQQMKKLQEIEQMTRGLGISLGGISEAFARSFEPHRSALSSAFGKLQEHNNLVHQMLSRVRSPLMEAVSSLNKSSNHIFALQNSLAQSFRTQTAGVEKLFEVNESWKKAFGSQQEMSSVLEQIANSSVLTATSNLGHAQTLLSQIDLERFAKVRQFNETDISNLTNDLSLVSLSTQELCDSIKTPTELFKLPANTLPGAARAMLLTSTVLDSLIYSSEDEEQAEEYFDLEELRKDVDECESLLAEINSKLLEPYEGAKKALEKKGPDYQRHFLTSLREMITHFLLNLAPDDKVKAWEPNKSNKRVYYLKGKKFHLTRTARILYIYREINHEPLSAVIDSDTKSWINFIDALQRTHELSPAFTERQLEMMLIKAKSMVVSFANL